MKLIVSTCDLLNRFNLMNKYCKYLIGIDTKIEMLVILLVNVEGYLRKKWEIVARHEGPDKTKYMFTKLLIKLKLHTPTHNVSMKNRSLSSVFCLTIYKVSGYTYFINCSTENLEKPAKWTLQLQEYLFRFYSIKKIIFQ